MVFYASESNESVPILLNRKGDLTGFPKIKQEK